MAVKPFQTQDGIKINLQDGLMDNSNRVILSANSSGPTIHSGEDASSPYWLATVNGSSTPVATVEQATAITGAAPIVTLSALTLIPDATLVKIVGAEGMIGLNDTNYWTKNVDTNQYELYTDSELTTFNDLSGEDAYVEQSGSLAYNSFSAWFNSVAHDSDGNVFAAGTTESNYLDQVVIAKYSSTGTCLWLQILEDVTLNLDGWGLAVDSDQNVFLTVNNESKILILKLQGSNGSIIWQTGITSPTGEYGYNCELDSDGNPVIAGTIANAEDSTTDFLVAKVSNADGTLIWSKQLGRSLYQYAYSLACDSAGGIYVAGYTATESYDDLVLIKLDGDGDVEFTTTIQGYDDSYNITGIDTAFDSDGNIYISATGGHPDNGEIAAFLIKLTSSGSFAWARVIGPGPCSTVATSLAVDSQDNIYMTAVNGMETVNDLLQFDFVIGCYNTDGDPLWQRYWGNQQTWDGSAWTLRAGQMLSIHNDYMALAGWIIQNTPNNDTYGQVGALVAQLPKDGSLVSIGGWRMRRSYFTGASTLLNTAPLSYDVTDNPLEQSSSDLTFYTGGYVATTTSDWPTQEHEWNFESNGSLSVPGQLNLTNTAFAEDIWIGPPVTFVKTNYGDERDFIDTDMVITRAFNQGLFNIALQESYTGNGPQGTEWNADGWTDLSDVTDRLYDTWQEIVYPPNQYIGREFVMHDTINDKYYAIAILSWQPGDRGGAVSYVRRQINTNVYFTKTDGGTEVDYIDVGLSITRGNDGIIYNPQAGETDYDTDYSPINTLWNGDGWDDLENLEQRQWLSFYYVMGGNQIGKAVLGREWVMWDTNNNQYYAIEFTQWQPGGGGAFKYIRRKVNKSAPTAGIKFADGTVQKTAWNKASAGILPQVPYNSSNDRWLNISDIGKHILFTQSGTEIYIPVRGAQPWEVGATITIVNRSGGNIYLNKNTNDESGTIYGAGTADSSNNWLIPDNGGGNICTLICIEAYGYDSPTVNWMLSGPGIETN